MFYFFIIILFAQSIFYYYKMKSKLESWFTFTHTHSVSFPCSHTDIYRYHFTIGVGLRWSWRRIYAFHGVATRTALRSSIPSPFRSTSGAFRRSNRLSYDWWLSCWTIAGHRNIFHRNLLALPTDSFILRCCCVCWRLWCGGCITLTQQCWTVLIMFILMFTKTNTEWLRWTEHFKCKSIVREMF